MLRKTSPQLKHHQNNVGKARQTSTSFAICILNCFFKWYLIDIS